MSARHAAAPRVQAPAMHGAGTLTAARPHCPHTAELAGMIAADAAGPVDLLSELIGAGNEATSVLAAARLVVTRMGMVADRIAETNGVRGWAGGADTWLLQDDGAISAWQALESTCR